MDTGQGSSTGGDEENHRRAIKEQRDIIVEAMLMPGASVARVVNANYVFYWRKL